VAPLIAGTARQIPKSRILDPDRIAAMDARGIEIGSDGYLAWLDNVLQIRQTANDTFDASRAKLTVPRSTRELRS
jgi:hypothetical protein